MTATSALFAVMRQQILVGMSRPMNLASGIVSPLLFMTLLTAPRLTSLTPVQATTVFSGSLLASLWASSMWSSAGILRRERWSGTLAPSFMGRLDPVPVMLGKTLGAISYDVCLILATQVVFCLVFRVRLQVLHPVAVVVGLLAVVACGVASSLMVGALLILTKYAFQLTAAFGTPILLFGGTLIPLTMLPKGISWIGWLVNLSWLQKFMASTSGNVAWLDLAVGVLVSVVYTVIGVKGVHVMLNRARKEGTIDLT